MHRSMLLVITVGCSISGCKSIELAVGTGLRTFESFDETAHEIGMLSQEFRRYYRENDARLDQLSENVTDVSESISNAGDSVELAARSLSDTAVAIGTATDGASERASELLAELQQLGTSVTGSSNRLPKVLDRLCELSDVMRATVNSYEFAKVSTDLRTGLKEVSSDLRTGLKDLNQAAVAIIALADSYKLDSVTKALATLLNEDQVKNWPALVQASQHIGASTLAQVTWLLVGILVVILARYPLKRWVRLPFSAAALPRSIVRIRVPKIDDELEAGKLVYWDAGKFGITETCKGQPPFGRVAARASKNDNEVEVYSYAA